MSYRSLFLTAAFLLTGCWDRVELEKANPDIPEPWPSTHVQVLPSGASHICGCPDSR